MSEQSTGLSQRQQLRMLQTSVWLSLFVQAEISEPIALGMLDRRILGFQLRVARGSCNPVFRVSLNHSSIRQLFVRCLSGQAQTRNPGPLPSITILDSFTTRSRQRSIHVIEGRLLFVPESASNGETGLAGLRNQVSGILSPSKAGRTCGGSSRSRSS